MYQPIPLNGGLSSASRGHLQQIPFGQPIMLSQGHPSSGQGYQMMNLNRPMPVGPQSRVHPIAGQQYPSSFMPPSYLVRPMPIVRRNPQQDVNANFDYESANFLCEAKIIESTIYCVLCQCQYKTSEKDEHIKKHMRKSNLSPIKKDVTDKLNAYRKENKETKKGYTIKPIVEPEDYNVQYEPTVYNLVKEVQFLDDSDVEKCERGIGNEGNSFSFYDNNVTLNNNALNYVPNRLIETEPNPFVANPSQLPLHPYRGDDDNSPIKKNEKKNLLSQIKAEPQIIEEQQIVVEPQIINSKYSVPDKSKSLAEPQVKDNKSSEHDKSKSLVEPQINNSKSSEPDKSKSIVVPQVKDSKSNASSSIKPINPIKVTSVANNRPEDINESVNSASPQRVSSAFKKKPQRMTNSLANFETSKISNSLKKDSAQPIINSSSQQVPIQQQSSLSAGQISNKSKSSLQKPPQRQSDDTPPIIVHPQDTTFNRESFSRDFTQYVPEQQLGIRGPVDQLDSFSGPIEIKGPTNEQSKKQSDNITQLLKQFGGDQTSSNAARKRLPYRVQW